jgi:NADPH2 dehydrogenase
MIVEATAVLPDGRVSRSRLGAYSDRHTDGLAKLARIIHDSGAVAGIQLHHTCMKAFQGPWMEPEGQSEKTERIPDLTQVDLEQVGQAFVAGALSASSAGFGIIELHSAHGYLLSQLLSPLANWRKNR